MNIMGIYSNLKARSAVVATSIKISSVFCVASIGFLTSCSDKTSLQTVNVVQIPSLPTELSFSLPSNCKFEPVEIAVFGDEKQKIRFDYKLCGKDKSKFSISNYRRIMLEEKSFIVIDKLRHHTPKSYMEAMAKNAHPDKCFAVETPEKLWLLIAEPYSPSPAYPFSVTHCGRYEGFSGPKGWVFAIKDGIVFGFKQENVKEFIDLKSITFIEYSEDI